MRVEGILLASQSSFRKALLESTGLHFDCATSRFNEESVKGGTPADIAMQRAIGKAMDVSARFPQHLVIGADQVLGMDGVSYGKVASKEEAEERLKLFAGKMHELINGICLVYCATKGAKPVVVKQFHANARMHMRTLGDVEISAYLERSYEWQGVVGCYRFESLGVNFFSKVEGDSSTIIGLPLLELLASLRACGIDPLVQPLGPWESTLQL
jgi:septum formation protein